MAVSTKSGVPLRSASMASSRPRGSLVAMTKAWLAIPAYASGSKPCARHHAASSSSTVCPSSRTWSVHRPWSSSSSKYGRSSATCPMSTWSMSKRWPAVAAARRCSRSHSRAGDAPPGEGPPPGRTRARNRPAGCRRARTPPPRSSSWCGERSRRARSGAHHRGPSDSGICRRCSRYSSRASPSSSSSASWSAAGLPKPRSR